MKIICCEDAGLIEEEIKKNLNKKKYKKLFLSENYDELHMIIFQNSLFEQNNENVFLIYDSNKIISSKLDENFVNFFKEIYNSNKNIIFVSQVKDVSKSFSNLINKNDLFIIKKLNKLTMKEYIRKKLYTNGINLSEDLLKILYESLPANSLIIDNEIEKIVLYLLNNTNKFDSETVCQLIISDINNNIFEIVNAFFQKDFETITLQLNLFEKMNTDFIEIYNILVSQVFLLKLYKIHYLKNKNINLLLKDFSIQMFQIEKQINIIYSTDLNCIDMFLKNLLKLDIDFMSGKKDLSIALKILLINGGEYGI